MNRPSFGEDMIKWAGKYSLFIMNRHRVINILSRYVIYRYSLHDVKNLVMFKFIIKWKELKYLMCSFRKVHISFFVSACYLHKVTHVFSLVSIFHFPSPTFAYLLNVFFIVHAVHFLQLRFYSHFYLHHISDYVTLFHG